MHYKCGFSSSRLASNVSIESLLCAHKDIHEVAWQLQGRNIVFGNEQKKGEEKKGVPVTPAGHVMVPERASETARKILETLDMMTPSPQEKSLNTELALMRERPPTELTTSMMNEQALRTMQVTAPASSSHFSVSFYFYLSCLLS